MKRGISVLSLGIVLVIMAIISSVIVISTRDSIDNLNKVRFITDYMSVESAVNTYYSYNDTYPILEEINLKFNENSTSQFEGENIADATVVLNKIDISQLGLDDLILGNGKSENDYYAISLQTGRIYYIAGFNYNENVYYKVTKDLNQDYED